MSSSKYVIRLVPTYEEFLQQSIKYSGDTKCFVFDCNKKGLYEGGDGRFYCGMCEEHAGLRNSYRTYLGNIIRDDEHMLTEEELHDEAQAKMDKLYKRLEEALNGPEFSKTE